MPSFDTVSEVNMAEFDNALQQTKKEVDTRYDLRGAKVSLDRPSPQSVQVKADGEERVAAVREIVLQKLAKRGISLRNLEMGKVEASGGAAFKQVLTVREGIAADKLKTLSALVRDSKIKVQASIQGEALRVTGKSRDDLQAVMQLLRTQAEELDLSLQFTNFRD